MRVAALDLGSNTSLLLVAEVAAGRVARVISDQSTVTKMGQGVHQSRKFHPDALARVRAALEKYRAILEETKPDKILAVATSAARDVANQVELTNLAKELGIPLQIISGQREAEMTFLGAVSDEPNEDGLAVIDVGGGSTELILQHLGERLAVSANVGSVRLFDLFGGGDGDRDLSGHARPASPEKLAKAQAFADEQFRAAKPALKGNRARSVIGVAGTPTTLAALEWNEPFSEGKVHGFKLTAETVEKWIQTLGPLSIPEREKFRGLQPQRADVIVMGAITLRSAMRALECEEITVSVRGLRYGLALELAK